MEIISGKFKNPLWKPSDLLWDGDLNPEGAALKLSYSPKDNVDFFLNSAFFLLEESSSHNNEATMWAFQPGFKISHGNAYWKNAFTLYAGNDLKGRSFNESAGTNNSDNYNYSCGAYSTELGMKLKNAPINYIGVIGDLVYNPDPSTGNTGFLFGVKLGDKKVKKKGQWQAKALYRRLEKDSWIDAFPDSDTLSGKTDVKGPEFIFKYAVAKNVVFGADYYYTKRISSDVKEHLLQLDMVYKF